jgi:hypothetical protein
VLHAQIGGRSGLAWQCVVSIQTISSALLVFFGGEHDRYRQAAMAQLTFVGRGCCLLDVIPWELSRLSRARAPAVAPVGACSVVFHAMRRQICEIKHGTDARTHRDRDGHACTQANRHTDTHAHRHKCTCTDTDTDTVTDTDTDTDTGTCTCTDIHQDSVTQVNRVCGRGAVGTHLRPPRQPQQHHQPEA